MENKKKSKSRERDNKHESTRAICLVALLAAIFFFSVTYSFDAKRNIITTRRFFLGKDSLTE
jgi:hypothetical protein